MAWCFAERNFSPLLQWDQWVVFYLYLCSFASSWQSFQGLWEIQAIHVSRIYSTNFETSCFTMDWRLENWVAVYKSTLEMNNLHSIIHFIYIDCSLASAFVFVKWMLPETILFQMFKPPLTYSGSCYRTTFFACIWSFDQTLFRNLLWEKCFKCMCCERYENILLNN